MSKNDKISFNVEDFKNFKEQIKKASTDAKIEYDEKNAEVPKQSIGNKIIGVIMLIVLLVLVVVVVVSNLELFFMPKNSVTIVVSDQNGNLIEGLEIYVNSSNHSFTIDFDENSSTNITELGVKPGEYTLTFENIPSNYNCDKIVDYFTMTDGDKIKLKYECTKESE